MNLIVKPIWLRILSVISFKTKFKIYFLHEAFTDDLLHMAVSDVIPFMFKYLKHTTGKILF